MDFHILGPLEVLDDGQAIALGGRRQRALLAVLLVHVNETLTTDRLIDELWGERPPPTAVRTLHVQVSRLRKALADGAASSDAGRGGPISTHEHGYAILVERPRLDAHRFEDLVAEGGRELAAGRPAPAASAFGRALALWRGAPLGDLAYERFAQREVARLEELRVGALEQLVDAQLELGRHADAAGQLRDLIAEHPYRERFRGQLMLALYRCDRQADALQVFQDTRRVLVEELGIEPGERLRELERAILAHDAALEAPAKEEAPQPPAREETQRRDAVRANARKVVTVVVADPAGSTALADGLDPESLHGALGHWSARCAGVLERHGGTVEESAGDAVVGVFGLGDRHEDDPLRAVRAALELRDASATPDRDRGPAVAVGVGIDSGEVFVAPDAGPGARVRGDAMHVAAALGQAAADGEILVAERAQRFVAHAVRAERVEPLEVRGRREAVQAWRVLELAADEPLARSSSATPFVARERELAALQAALARATGGHGCHRVTVVGPPGIGKSRLAHEFVDGLGDEPIVAVGRCLSYGDGIAYRPLAEMLRRLAGEEPEQWLRARVAGDERVDTIVRHVLGAIGRADEASQTGETSWAMRMLFEAVARDRPLVVIVEDAHWADPTLLDLLEYVLAFSSGAPILLLCLARPELLEERPAWAAPQHGSSLVEIDPLAAPDARALVEAARADVAPVVAQRIVAAAEGNPLFLEQLLAASAEDGPATALPPSIEAVLAARIDRLEPHEREVLAHASLEGRQFHAGAVGALMPDADRSAIATALLGLVRKQFIHPDRPEFPGEDGFRFAHALIRDAAYAGMPKQLRGELHERLADWLKERPGAPDELVGYHLEQAVRYRGEVGRLDPHDRALAGEAADRLAAAARSALVRGDAAAAGRLLERAVTLVPAEDQARPALLTTLGATFVEAGRLADADRVLDEAIARADSAGDVRIGARARTEQELARLYIGASGGTEQARLLADSALQELERNGDEFGLCRAWRLRAWIEWIESRAAAADAAWRRATTHARRAGDEREVCEILGWRASAAAFGPTPVGEAIRRCEQIREQVRSSPVGVAVTLHPLGLLHAMRGDFALARSLVAEADAILGELGRMDEAVSHHEALLELLAGRPDVAEAHLRAGYAVLERMGERPVLAGTAAMLAQAVYLQGRHAEAKVLCGESERHASLEDVATQAMWRGVAAKVHATEGRHDEAEATAREAVRLVEPTDLLNDHGDVLLDLAEVLRLAGRTTEAGRATQRALTLYERKGNLVSAARARSWPTVAALL